MQIPFQGSWPLVRVGFLYQGFRTLIRVVFLGHIQVKRKPQSARRFGAGTNAPLSGGVRTMDWPAGQVEWETLATRAPVRSIR